MNRSPFKPLMLAVGLALASGAIAAPTSALDPTSFDTDIAACTDFYGYVNGKWAAANPVPADKTRWGTFDELREASLATQRGIAEAASKPDSAPAGSVKRKLGDFYASGMDETAIDKAGIAPLKPQLARIDALRTPQSLVEFITATQTAGSGLVFELGSEADFKDSTKRIAYAMQGGLGLPERAYYLEDKPDYEKIRAAYLDHIVNTLTLAGIGKAQARKQAQWVMAIETRLATASLAPIELRAPENQYHYVSIADADKVTPHLGWAAFFKAQGVDGIDGFSLSHPKFFGEFDKMLTEIPAEQWRAYLRYHTIDEAAPYLGKAFVQEHFAFHNQTLRGQKEIQPRWKRVLAAINDGIGEGMGELYVAETFPPESKRRAAELVDNLGAALKQRIESLEWMSDETKAKALEKWATFMPKVGYPDHWRDWSGLDVGRAGYLANVQAAARFNHAWDMSRIGKPIDRAEWGMTPQTVNAYYNPLKNEIVFPAAILQPPYFDAKADDALNYGGIGAVIGHEMSHGYDDQGSQFDAQGNFNNWWTASDREQFEARTGKLVKQFDDYVAIDDLHVKGELTLGENIADLGGLATAYDALHLALKQHPQQNHTIDGLTPDQRLFINWARVWRTNIRPQELKVMINTNPHAPGQFRAIAAPSNLPAFAAAFGCKSGDAMVRDGDRQVKIW